jgi:hypothetical protein
MDAGRIGGACGKECEEVSFVFGAFVLGYCQWSVVSGQLYTT